MAHIDLHLHLLPGVDDGAPDEAVTLEHAARMVADGVREATVTPHVGAPAIPLDPLSIPGRTAAAVAAGAAGVQARRLTYANPRLLLRDGLPGGTHARDHRLHGSLERARQARRRLVRSR